MPAISLLLPPALLAAGGLLAWSLAVGRRRPVRVPAGAGAALALAALIAEWASNRTTLEVTGPVLGAGVRADFRLDALTVAFMAMVLVPGTVLLAAQRRTALEAASGCLSLAGCCLALEAANVPLTALAVGGSAVLLTLPHRSGAPAGMPRAFSLWQAVALVMLLWSGATLEAQAGTGAYQAIPVTAFGVASFALLALAGLLLAGLTPWRSWVVDALERGLSAAPLSVAALPPIGFYLLVRAYDAGGGHYPSSWLNLALAVLGAAVAGAAALRAQAASSRRAFMAELVAANAGFALFAIALGSPLGLAAGITVLLSQALISAACGVSSAGRSWHVLVVVLAALGVPPGVAFGGRLLAIQAGLEGGETFGFLTVTMVLGWVLLVAAGARAWWLPADGEPAAARLSGVGAGLAVVALAGGAALGSLESALAIPAAAEVIAVPATALAASPSGVITASGAWPSLAFGVPMLLLGGIAVYLGRSRLAEGALPAARRRTVRPMIASRLAGRLDAGVAGQRSWRLPDEYRTLFDPRALDTTVSAGRPLLWIVVAVGLAYVITR